MRAGSAFAVILIAVFAGTYIAVPVPTRAISTLPENQDVSRLAHSDSVEASVVYYRCKDAWAAGAAPIYEGQPGYWDGLDGDGDGIACEPLPHHSN